MDYQGKKILVTGADGFIGSHLAEALVAAGAEVTALSLYNAFSTHGWLDELPGDTLAAMRIVGGNLCDPAFMLRLVEGQEVVFHLGALIAIPHSYEAVQSYVDVNVGGAVNLFEAARAHGVTRIVHTSTSEVYGTALVTPITEEHPLQGQSPYAASKIGADMMAEAYARSFDLPIVILRPFNTYGPKQSERAVIPTVIRQALDPACAAICVGDLTPTRDFNYVTDTVAAFMSIGDSEAVAPGQTFNSGTGVAVSIGETVELIRGITGVNKPVESDDNRFRPKKSEVRDLLADAGKLTEATGWRPRVPFEEGLAMTVDWWRGRIRSGAVRRQNGYAT